MINPSSTLSSTINMTPNNNTSTLGISKPTSSFNTSVKDINWDIQNNTNTNSYDWTSSGWVFGPKPTYSIVYASNNTPVTQIDSVYFGTQIKIQIIVPLSAITTGNPLGQTGINLNYFEYSSSGSGSAINYQPSYSLNGFIGFDNISNTWSNTGYAYNYQTNQQSQVQLFQFTSQSKQFDSVNKIATITMQGQFNSQIKSGRYYLNLQVTDNQYNYVDASGYNNYNDVFAPNRDLWINAPYQATQYYGYGDGFTAQLENNLQQAIDGTKRGVPTLMAMNISSSNNNVDKVIFEVPIPSSYTQLINKTESYNVQKTYPAGWIWNATLNTYVWSPVNVTVTEQVYGPHEVLENFPITNYFLDASNNYYYLNWYFIYNPVSNTFSTKIGYDSYNYLNYQSIRVYLRTVNSGSSDTDKLIYLNGGSFSKSSGQLNGFFNFTASPMFDSTQGEWYNIYVNETDGTNLYAYDGSSYGNLNIDKKVAKVSIFDNTGTEVTNSFKVKAGQSFLLSATVQGDTNSIDAGSMVLEGYSYSYTQTSSQWTDLELIVRYDWKLNQVSVFGYNSTSRNVLQNGTYWDWVQVTKSGWHWEWNNNAANYVWTNGNYTDWVYQQVTGEHWVYQYYDQVSLKWVDGWVPLESDSNLIGGLNNNSSLFQVNKASIKSVGGQLQLNLNVTVTANTPQLRYSFQSEFAQRQFTQDYSSGYGPTTSQIWFNAPVATINTGSGNQYVDIIKNPLYIYYMGKEYRITETPYIEIATGKIAVIKTFNNYDFNTNTNDQFFINYQYDYFTGTFTYYYTLLNGTRITIDQGTGVTVYDIKFNTTSLVGVKNNTEIYSLIPYAIDNSYYDYNTYSYVYQWSFILLNGTVLTFKDPNYTFQTNQWYNSVTGQYQYNKTQFTLLSKKTVLVSNPVYKLPLYKYSSSQGTYVQVNSQTVQDDYVGWDWMTNKYYVINPTSGNQYYFNLNSTWTNSDSYLAQYTITINGTTYASYPWGIVGTYTVNYKGNNYSVQSYMDNIHITSDVYYVDGAPQLQLLPTNNQPAQSQTQLDNTQSSGIGVVPTLKSFTYQGQTVNIKLTSNGYDLAFINGTSLGSVAFSDVKADKYLALVNGQEVWNASLSGFDIQYGSWNTQNNKFTPAGNFTALTAKDQNGQYINQFNYLNYNYVLNTTDSSQIKIEWKPLAYQVHVSFPNGTSFNTTYAYFVDYYPYNSTYEYVFFSWYDAQGNYQYVYYLPIGNLPTISYIYFTTFSGTDSTGYQTFFINYYGLIMSISDWNTNNYGNYIYDYWVKINGVEKSLDYNYYGNDNGDGTYTYHYGSYSTIDGSWVIEGSFLANLDSTGSPFNFYGYQLTNATDSSTIPVTYGQFISVYEVQLTNGTTFNSTIASPNYNYQTQLYYLTDWLGNNYTVQGYDAFSVLQEYHLLVHPDNGSGYPYFTFQGINITSDYSGYFYSSTFGHGQYNRYYWYYIMLNGQEYVLQDYSYWQPILSLPLPSGTYTITVSDQPIQKVISYTGYPWRWVYTAVPNLQTVSNVYEIVIGNPKSDVWNYQSWTTTPSGAIDLDGDFSTTNDQYYVLRVYTSANTYTLDEKKMLVNIFWDPSNSTDSMNNEYTLSAFMGISTATWSWTWSEKYYWYHASDFSSLSTAEFATVNHTINDPATGQPNAGYWGISYLATNQTSAQLAAQAAANGWDWISSNTFSTTWLSFGFGQDFYSYDTVSTAWIHQQMQNEWTGFFLYNDTNGDGIATFTNSSSEVTHVFIPSGISGLSFTSPGTAFGNTALSGDIYMINGDPNFNKQVDFGVTFNNVTGTTYPVFQDVMGNWVNVWQLSQGHVIGAGLSTFKDRPTKVSIDQVSFQLHFNIVNTNPQYATVNLKLDQIVGNWNVSAIGGRSALKGYSLAITYFSYLTSSATYQVTTDSSQQVNNNQGYASNSFTFSDGNLQIAKATLNGDYSWDKNKTLPLKTATYSAPISQFQETYTSVNGGQTIGFSIQSSMYFFAIGFPKWDGYRVFQDPSFSAVAAVAGASPVKITVAPKDVSASAGQSVQLSWTATGSSPTTYEAKDQNGNLVPGCSGSWISNTPVICTISNLQAGTHTYTITFHDANGNSAQDSVVVTVGSNNNTGTVTATQITSNTSQSSNKGAPGFELLPFLAVMMVVVPIIINRRKRNA